MIGFSRKEQSDHGNRILDAVTCGTGPSPKPDPGPAEAEHRGDGGAGRHFGKRDQLLPQATGSGDGVAGAREPQSSEPGDRREELTAEQSGAAITPRPRPCLPAVDR